jgi:hypothetical protein
MNEYLNGYLSVIPLDQRQQIVSEIMTDQNVYPNIDQNDYEALIKKLAEGKEKLTQYIKVVGDIDKLSPEQFMTFHGQVYADLYYLFRIADLIEKAVINYEYIHAAELSSLQREIDKLKIRINDLKLRSEEKSTVFTTTENFSNTSTMESPTNYAHLYTDRDGTTPLPYVQFQPVGSSNQITLNVIDSVNRLSSGVEIKVADYRPQPVNQVQYPITNAIDDSLTSFWGEVVLTTEEVNVALDDCTSGDMDGSTVIPAGGAISKVVITLPQPVSMNEIIITPFTVYPLEISCIKYEKDPDIFEPVRYIISPSAPIESNETMYIRFSSVIARRLTIYLKQKSYTTNSYLINESEKEDEELWNLITLEEQGKTLESYATSGTDNSALEQDKLDEWSGWKAYLQQLETYKQEVQNYIDDIKEYNSTYGLNVSYNLPEWVKQLPDLNF